MSTPADRRCAHCGGPLTVRQQKWCSPACSQTAYRDRQREDAIEVPYERTELKERQSPSASSPPLRLA